MYLSPDKLSPLKNGILKVGILCSSLDDGLEELPTLPRLVEGVDRDVIHDEKSL